MLQGAKSLDREINRVMPTAIATGRFKSLVTFLDFPGGNPVTNSSGQVDMTNLVPVAGLVNIPCMFAAAMLLRPDASGGARMPDHFVERAVRHLLLNGYYPAVLQRYIAVVDGVQYEIIPGADEPDSQHQMTRLSVRLYQL